MFQFHQNFTMHLNFIQNDSNLRKVTERAWSEQQEQETNLKGFWSKKC